jgi:hypothetical protein
VKVGISVKSFDSKALILSGIFLEEILSIIIFAGNPQKWDTIIVLYHAGVRVVEGKFEEQCKWLVYQVL